MCNLVLLMGSDTQTRSKQGYHPGKTGKIAVNVIDLDDLFFTGCKE